MHNKETPHATCYAVSTFVYAHIYMGDMYMTYVRVHVLRMYAHVCAVHAYMFMYVYAYSRMYVCTYVRMCVCTYTYVGPCVHVCVYTCVDMRICDHGGLMCVGWAAGFALGLRGLMSFTSHLSPKYISTSTDLEGL